MGKIDAVIFDMDGLLIDSEPLWKLAEIKVFGTVGIDLTAQGCEETVGLRIDQVVDLWHNRHPWNNKSKKQVIHEIVEEMVYLINKEGKELPGASETVRTAKETFGKVGLATSSYEVLIHAVLEKLDIKPFFNALHSAQHEKYGKPHPQVFLSCAEKLVSPPEKCLVFEDSLNGVIAAKAARMKVIAVPEKTHEYHAGFALADKIVASLKDFDWQHLS